MRCKASRLRQVLHREGALRRRVQRLSIPPNFFFSSVSADLRRLTLYFRPTAASRDTGGIFFQLEGDV